MSKELTKHRTAILGVIASSDIPLNAKEVHKRVKKINLATIYRALQYLEGNHYIAGFTIMCSEEGVLRYYYRHVKPDTHFLHCEKCHSFFPYTDCSISSSMGEIERQYDFAVHAHILYFIGVCGICRHTKEEK